MINLDKFEKTYTDAQKTIKKFLEPNSYEKINGLIKWMVETEVDPFAFVPKFSNTLYTAEGFANFLNLIHYSVYDDGKLEFVKVNGEPRMVFVDRNTENFRDYVLTEQEKLIEKEYNSVYEIEVLNIEPKDFGPLCDTYLFSILTRK